MEKPTQEITELPVWVGGAVKWVTGLTKRTTCDDIIYALLHNEGNTNEDKDTANYTIYERWGGVEKPLKGRTKILKLWRSWGSELESVEFYLRKNQDYIDSSEIFRSRRYRKAHHKLRQQRRNKKTSESSTSSDKDKQTESTVKAKTLEGLVKQVLSQEKTLREQCERIEYTDKCIDEHETKIHAYRVMENGHNYVQDAYLHEKAHNISSSDEMDADDLERYLNLLQHLVQVETKLIDENKKIDQLSNQILEFSQISGIPSAMDTTTVDYPQFSTPIQNNHLNIQQNKLKNLTEISKKYLDMSLNETDAEPDAMSQTFRVEQLKLKYKMKRDAPTVGPAQDTVDVSQLFVTACEEPSEDINEASMFVHINDTEAMEDVQTALDISLIQHDKQCNENAQLDADITIIDEQLKLKRLELSALEEALVQSEELQSEQPPKLAPKHNASNDTEIPRERGQKPPRPPRIDMKKVGDNTVTKQLSVEEQCKLLILGDCDEITHIGGSTSPGSSISDEGYGNSNSFDSSSNDEQSPLPFEDKRHTHPTKSILSKPKYNSDNIDHIDRDIHEVNDDCAMNLALKPTANPTACHEYIKDDISQQFSIHGSPNSSKTTITDTYIQQYIRAKSSGQLHNSMKRRVTFGGVTYDSVEDDSDSNSDTGLSSLHSEDVSPLPVCTVLETLV